MREALHFLGWHGKPVEEQILRQVQAIIDQVRQELTPRVVLRRFTLNAQQELEGTAFSPQGEDVKTLLRSCDEAVLLAATLGAQSERLLLRQQACSSADALLLDAVLSAAIEAVCDEQEDQLRRQLEDQGLYLTDRFSPGYGDMPLAQTKEICAVLQTDKTIGLTVSSSGIMIPRKSVTAIMGVSSIKTKRRAHACDMCTMRDTCALRDKT